MYQSIVIVMAFSAMAYEVPESVEQAEPPLLNLYEFSTLHLVKPNFAPQSGVSSFLFGPFVGDISECVSRANEIGVRGELKDYAINILYQAEVITYEYHPIHWIESAAYLSRYSNISNEAEYFNCMRYSGNPDVIIAVADQE